MSVPVTLEQRTHLPLHQRALPLLAVAIARVLARLRPHRLRTVLEQARRGARPATAEEAAAARAAVVTVSLRCAGKGCLQRSIATALLCRTHGSWPTWCTGVRTHPFTAHAWIEAHGQPIGEPHPAGHYRTLLTIPALPPKPARPRTGRERGLGQPACGAEPRTILSRVSFSVGVAVGLLRRHRNSPH